MSEFGEAMARHRNEVGMNQRELAAAISLDPTQVNKVERGQRPPLGAKYMVPLVRALRLTGDEAKNLVKLAGHSPKVLDFKDEAADGQAVGQGQRAISKPTYSLAAAAKPIPDSLFGTSRQEFEN